eukprot:6149474-Pleurochrysis_carterae.AAC.6
MACGGGGCRRETERAERGQARGPSNTCWQCSAKPSLERNRHEKPAALKVLIVTISEWKVRERRARTGNRPNKLPSASRQATRGVAVKS